MTDRPLREIATGPRRDVDLIKEMSAKAEPPADAGRWLVGALIELSKRFLGMCLSAGFKEARQKQECPRCGWKG